MITSLHTAATVAELGMDAHTAAGAMLLGASGVLAAPRFEALVSSFPDDVAATVRHAQRMGDIVELEGATAASEALRGVLMAMADVRACVLRMSLSLQLLRQLQSRAPGDRGAFARACRDILVPLASRIGLSSLKVTSLPSSPFPVSAARTPSPAAARPSEIPLLPVGKRLPEHRRRPFPHPPCPPPFAQSEMEDLCFYHLEPETHASLRSRFHTAARRDALQTALDMTQAALTEAGVPLQDISGRVKSLQGIHRKVASKGIPPEAVLDAQALRVIVPTKEDCYAALRVVQRAFDPVAGHAKVKDYIREPKANGYRSLHAYVEVPGGTPVEVQIRTMDMHLVSEYGAAAHWRYKERLGQDSLAGCASKMVAYAKYILSWELEVHDAKCKPRHSESQGGDAVRSHASACVFPKHDVDCNR